MTIMLADGRDRDASVARMIFDLPPVQANKRLPVLDRCARPMCEVYT